MPMLKYFNYICVLSSMISGLMLLTNAVAVDECASNPCMNGATCVDSDHSFTCTCQSRYTGMICDSKHVFVLRLMYYFLVSFFV